MFLFARLAVVLGDGKAGLYVCVCVCGGNGAKVNLFNDRQRGLSCTHTHTVLSVTQRAGFSLCVFDTFQFAFCLSHSGKQRNGRRKVGYTAQIAKHRESKIVFPGFAHCRVIRYTAEIFAKERHSSPWQCLLLSVFFFRGRLWETNLFFTIMGR